MAKTLNDLYREGKMPNRAGLTVPQQTGTHSQYTPRDYYIPPNRQRKGYWVGFWLGFFLQIIPGTLIAWAVQTGIDRDRYIGRYIIGSIHGWLSLIGIAAFAFLAVFVISMR